MVRVWICLLLFCFTAHAHVQRLSPSEGLSQSYVSEMLIDNDGYLWLATENGVDRYDGHQLVNVKGLSRELSGVLIDDIYQDPQGNMWIAPMAAGLTKYDPKQGQFSRYLTHNQTSSSDFEHAIFSMLMVQGELWLGRGGNIARFDEQSNQAQMLFDYAKPEQQHITRAMVKHGERIYLGTSKGLYSLDESAQDTRHHMLPSSDEAAEYANNIRSLVSWRSRLLIGSEKGLFSLRTDGNQAQHATVLLDDINIWQIYPINERMILLATEQGLLQFDPQSAEVTKYPTEINPQFTLTDPAVISIQATKQGDLWVGTKNDGAFLLTQSRFTFTNLDDASLRGSKLSHHNVWSSAVLDGELVLGTSNGLTFVDLETLETRLVAQHDVGKTGVDPFTVYELFNYQGRLILSTVNGLFLYNPDTQQVSRFEVNQGELQPLLEQTLFGPALSESGHLYFVNKYQGFFRINLQSADIEKLEGDFTDLDPMQTQGFVRSTSSTQKEVYLFSGGGFYHIEPSSLTISLLYEVPKQYQSMEVYLNGFAHDRQGRMWLALANIGVIALDGQSYEQVSTLPVNLADGQQLFYDLILDDTGDLWMSSHQGIWRLNLQTMHLQQFTEEDGLHSNEFNVGSVEHLADGRILFGSIKGASILDPSLFTQQQAIVDQVNITSATLSYRRVKPSQLGPVTSVKLAHDDVGLELRFSAMQFNYQGRIAYEYQLDNSQRTINQSHNRLVFSRLTPGIHKLKVWAKDPFTGQLSPATELTICVDYPMWRHPWALFAYVLVGGGLCALWLYRKRKTQQLIMQAYDETAQSEARLKLALQGSHSGVWDWQKANHKIYQPRLKQELGYDYEQCTFEQFLSLIHPQQRQQYRIAWLAFLSTDKGYFENTYRLKDSSGHWRWYKDVGQVMQWEHGMPVRVAGTYTNMSREMLFAQRARMFGAAFEQSSDWLIILDNKLRIKAVNQALKEHTDYRPEASSSRHLTLGLSTNARMNYLRILKGLELGEHFQTRERVINKAGDVVPVILKLSKVMDSEGELSNYVISLTDTRLVQAVLDVSEERAQYDAQTGLAMRHVFIDRVSHALEVAMRENTGCALILIKVSQRTNPLVAQASVADGNILPLLAKRLTGLLRASDSVGLIQDNMFAVLIEPLHDIDQSITVSRKIRDGLIAPLNPPYEGIDVEVSLGIATYPEDATEALELSQCAAMAVYKAAKMRSNQCQFFANDLNEYVHSAEEIERQVGEAYKNAEFINLYQEIVDQQSQPLALEVLLRWQKSPSEQLMPEQFIGAVRSTDLWYKLLLQTLQRTLFERQSWTDEAAALNININICGREFFATHVVSEIMVLLKGANLPPHQLVFEIPLSQWLKLDTTAKHNLQSLTQQGVVLAVQVDQFDALSSHNLIDTPFSQLKFDTQVSKQICEQHLLSELAKKYVASYRAIGMTVVAVGIEAPAQLAQFKALGVSAFQGNYIQAPRRGDSF